MSEAAELLESVKAAAAGVAAIELTAIQAITDFENSVRAVHPEALDAATLGRIEIRMVQTFTAIRKTLELQAGMLRELMKISEHVVQRLISEG